MAGVRLTVNVLEEARRHERQARQEQINQYLFEIHRHFAGRHCWHESNQGAIRAHIRMLVDNLRRIANHPRRTEIRSIPG